MRRLLFTAALALCTTACSTDAPSGDDAEFGGTVVIATAADADFLLPPIIALLQGNIVADIIFERLAEPGTSLNTVGDEGFTPEIAESWEWAADSLSIAFRILPGSRFHDGHPLTAHDVAFTYELYTDPATASADAALLANVDSVNTRDSMTVVFWFGRRYPQQFFDATYHMRILPEHLLRDAPRRDLRNSGFAREPVGSGRFKFSRWEPGSLIELVADTAHPRGRPHLDRLVWSIAADHEAAMTRLVAGDADFIEMVRPNKFGEVSRDSNLALTPYPSLDIGFLHFNLRDPRAPRARHPVLGERGVRRALAMAIDGDALARAIFDSLGIKARGPFTRALATSDTTIAQLPFDPAGARALLDSLGWRDRDRNGVREKNGRPLRFAIVSPSISTARTRAGVLIQDMLKAVGVNVDLQQMDINPWLELLRSGSFDAALNGIHYDPSPATIRMSWTGQAARSGDGTNYGGYINPAFDRVVDSAVNEMDAERSRDLYRRAYEILINDAPAVWLYETVNYSAHHARLKPVNLRADAWWASIAEWRIPPGERLPRDRAREAVAQR